MSSASDDATPAAAAGAAWETAEPCDEWASTQRRRATRDGAWKIVVTERMVSGNIVRTVTSWHDSAKRQPTPLRRAQQHGGVSADRSQQRSTRSATDRHPQRKTSRQQRSALRSAAHHRSGQLRVLRRLWFAVCFLVRLSRLAKAARVLRAKPSPVKRRLSPSPDEQHHHLHRPTTSCQSGDCDVASPPPPKRLEVGRLLWAREAIARVVFGDG